MKEKGLSTALVKQWNSVQRSREQNDPEMEYSNNNRRKMDRIHREYRLKPETIAYTVAYILSLPNTASVSELPINTRLESTI